jgi:hypothetical protein
VKWTFPALNLEQSISNFREFNLTLYLSESKNDLTFATRIEPGQPADPGSLTRLYSVGRLILKFSILIYPN